MTRDTRSRLRVVPLTLARANDMVERLHRHHKRATGHRFSLGVIDDAGLLRGVCIVGRPVARMTDQTQTAEVLRVATDGCDNACSALLGAAARAARAMGYARIQTFTLPAEGGASLRGAGWVEEGAAGGGRWSCASRPRQDAGPTAVKTRWAKELAEPVEWRPPKPVQRPDPQVALPLSGGWVKGIAGGAG